jgi:hypothetical protein
MSSARGESEHNDSIGYDRKLMVMLCSLSQVRRTLSKMTRNDRTGRTPHHLSSSGAWYFLGNCSFCQMTKTSGIEQAIAFEHGDEYAQEPIGHTAECAGI